MKKRFILFIIIHFFLIKIQAQPGFLFHLKTGYAFNPKIDLNNQLIKESKGLVVDFGGAFKIPVYKKLYTEFGITGRTIFSSGKVEDTDFDAQTLRILFSPQLGFQLSKQWEIYSGVVFQNNKDFSKTDLREKFFWRANYTLGTRYEIAEKWYLSGEGSFDLRNVPDPFLINDPKFLFLIGLARRL